MADPLSGDSGVPSTDELWVMYHDAFQAEFPGEHPVLQIMALRTFAERLMARTAPSHAGIPEQKPVAWLYEKPLTAEQEKSPLADLMRARDATVSAAAAGEYASEGYIITPLYRVEPALPSTERDDDGDWAYWRARADQYLKEIEQHNEGCDAACAAQRPNERQSGGCGWQKHDGSQIYAKRCPTCPQDWKIKPTVFAPSSTARPVPMGGQHSIRRDGHSALRVKDGQLEKFDQHPETAPTSDSDEPAVAWLIVRHRGTGGAAGVHHEVVLSPLTDDVYMDEGDEAWPLYKRAPSASGKHPDTVRLDDIEQSKCYPFWNGDRWIYIVSPERSTKVLRRGEGPTARAAIDASHAHTEEGNGK